MNELATKIAETTKRLGNLGLGKVPKEPPGWTKEREAALQRFSQKGVPTSEDEAWKYTNVLLFVNRPFSKPDPKATAIPGNPALLSPNAEARLYFRNGRYEETLSKPSVPASLAKAPLVCNFSRALSDGKWAAEIEKYFGKAISADSSSFAWLNEAAFDDGGVVFVPPGVQMDVPLEIIFQGMSSNESASAVVPRLLIVVGLGAKAKIVQQYVAEEGCDQLVNAVVEIFVLENAELEMITVQREGGKSCHLGTTHVSQSKQSRFKSRTFGFKGSVVRNEMVVRLLGEGADCELTGLICGTAKQHFDTYTFVDHVVPRCRSRELYKCILDGQSTGVFFGRVRVEKDAQKTDSVQTNKNLLLSDEATMNSRPQLEIYADDVKCNHGSAIGQLDEAALFYLRSRGIGPAQAKQMLTYAFGAELVEPIVDKDVKAGITQYLHEVLG